MLTHVFHEFSKTDIWTFIFIRFFEHCLYKQFLQQVQGTESTQNYICCKNIYVILNIIYGQTRYV